MPTSSEVRRQLTVILGGVILIVLITLIPDLAPPSPDIGAPVEAYKGEILEIIPPEVGGSDAGGAPVFTAQVLLLDGALKGQTVTAFVEGPGGSQLVAAYAPGDQVVVTITQDANEPEPYIAVADRWRFEPIAALIILFAVGVTVVGGWQGVRALVALGLTIAVILKIILPLILQGVPPLPMAVVGATAITAATILLTEGWGKGSAAAILGTAGSLSVAGLIAAGVTAAAQFTYTSSDLAYIVTQGGSGLDLRGILLAAVILGSLGVLDDVTVTQAVVVDELSERGGLEGRELFRSALGIGRSHIGATVNTLFLAYVGASLPLLVVLLINNQPTALIWNNEEIATEIVRTLAGSLGIVAAVPLTTFVATLLVGAAKANEGDPAAQRRTQMFTIVPVLADHARRVRAPRGDGDPAAHQRSRRAADRGAARHARPASPARAATAASSSSGEPGPGRRAAPRGARRGGPDQHRRGGGRHGERRRLDARRPATAPPPSASRRPTRAKSDWPLDPGAWELLTADGTEVPLAADPPMPGSLAEGQAGGVHPRHRDRRSTSRARSSPTSTPRPPRSCSSSRWSSRRRATDRQASACPWRRSGVRLHDSGIITHGDACQEPDRRAELAGRVAHGAEHGRRQGREQVPDQEHQRRRAAHLAGIVAEVGRQGEQQREHHAQPEAEEDRPQDGRAPARARRPARPAVDDTAAAVSITRRLRPRCAPAGASTIAPRLATLTIDSRTAAAPGVQPSSM